MLRALPLAFASALLLLTACSRGDTKPTSLLLVTIDTLRADHVGAYGGPVPTPAMDSLAAAGVLVENAYTPTPTTAPAHASLMTGLHPWQHGVHSNAVPLPRHLPVLAEAMRSHGLVTAAFVSSAVLHARFGFARGFDLYGFVPGRRPDGSLRGGIQAHRTTDQAIRWLDELEPGRPFFLWVHYIDPHLPYDPPPYFRPRGDEPVDLEGKKLPQGVASLAELQRLIRSYGGEVGFSDKQLQRLLGAVRRRSGGRDIAVIVTSDHGEGLGDHGVLEHGTNLFDSLVRIPLLVVGPGIPAGRRLEGLVQLEDLAPTALALVGAPAPQGVAGHDLLPWLRGEVPASPRSRVVGRRRPYPGLVDLFFVRAGDEKWIGPARGPGLQFDLRRDPGERSGRPGDGAGPAVRRALGELAPTPGEAELDEEARTLLEALGYVGPDAERPHPDHEPPGGAEDAARLGGRSSE